WNSHLRRIIDDLPFLEPCDFEIGIRSGFGVDVVKPDRPMEDLFQRCASLAVDNRSSAAPIALLLPEVVSDVADHHLVPYILGLRDLFYPTIKLGIDMRIFAVHQRWSREKPSKAV